MDAFHMLLNNYTDTIDDLHHLDDTESKESIMAILYDAREYIDDIIEIAQSDKINYKDVNGNTLSNLILSTFIKYTPKYCSAYFINNENYSLEDAVIELFKNNLFDWISFYEYKNILPNFLILEKYIQK